MHLRIVSSQLPLNSSQATGVQWRFHILMSRIFELDKCTQALMDFCFSRMWAGLLEVESPEDEE